MADLEVINIFDIKPFKDHPFIVEVDDSLMELAQSIKEKYCNNINTSINDDLRERLIELRKTRSNEMNIPAYYVFTNDELDKLVELRPKTIEELKKSNILTSIKIKTHGETIIKEILK